ncbi:hypothetical protein BDZ97DRAFT_682772 [Flammula alnicola]|nr:hypothetical protein BDZ97DRAFT_682772 [Flammula alnicola]
MRAKEIARIARLKAEKEEKLKEKQRREQDKFTPPPMQYQKKDNRNRSSSMPTFPIASPMRNSSLAANTARPRKSSLSTSPSKGNKRVSWASSTSTLDVNGIASVKPLDEKPWEFPHPSDQSHSPFLAIPSRDTILSSVPRARMSAPHLSTSVEPRARRGREMIAATTPEVAISWARPVDPFVGKCTCSTSVDPLDISRTHFCEIHRYKD